LPILCSQFSLFLFYGGKVMLVCVLNGSPKGRMSVTMQFVKYLQIVFPSVKFEILDIAAHIARIERSADEFAKVIDSVRQADAVLFAFPVYFFLVPSQYKRFIELVFEKNAADAFFNKPSASLSTSVHIVDHTAHNYISGIAQDFGTRFFGAYSADMEDLLKKTERKNLETFFGAFATAVKNIEPAPRFNLSRNMGVAKGRRSSGVRFMSFRVWPRTMVTKCVRPWTMAMFRSWTAGVQTVTSAPWFSRSFVSHPHQDWPRMGQTITFWPVNERVSGPKRGWVATTWAAVALSIARAMGAFKEHRSMSACSGASRGPMR
jgi:NAD(P)H-dependent FMN reductase